MRIARHAALAATFPRAALAATLATIGFRAHPVIDARGWADAASGIRATLDRWLDRPVPTRGPVHA